MFSTVLATDELITAIAFPKPQAAAYVKFPNPASRYAVVGVMVAKTASGVRVAVTGAGADGVFRSADMERALASSRSEEHTSELQSLMRISYAVFCLNKKKKHKPHPMHK